MNNENLNEVLEIVPGVWWLGYNVEEIWGRTNAYLLVEGDEAVLFDPGSVLDYEIIKNKIQKVIPIDNLEYIVLHHQDPDLCSSTVEFEKLTNVMVITTERAALFCSHYGIKSFSNTISKDNDILTFRTGRKLRFFLTPYCHSPMSMVTYDEQNKVLFTSDLFSAYHNIWNLYADEIGNDVYINSMKDFMEPLMASNEAVMNFVNKVEPLDINLICPQHGSLIRHNIDWWFNQIKNMQFGKAIREGKTGIEIQF